MNRSFSQEIQNVLGKFISYQKLVGISNMLNYPLVHPITASILITSRCNSKCIYCSVWRLGDGCQYISIDKLDKLFHSLKKIGVQVIFLSGGEPLIRHDLEEIISLAKYYDLMVEVCTNGILLTKRRAHKLIESGVDNIILSLDSLDPEIYEIHRGVPFKYGEQALETLLHIKSEHPTVTCSVTCVVTRYNIGTLVSFINQIHEYAKGKISIDLQPYNRSHSYSLDLLENLSPKLRKLANKVLSYQKEFSKNERKLLPTSALRTIFEKEIHQLINLKKNKHDFPLNNSEFYLKSMPDFLFDNKMPSGLNCVSGYVRIIIRSDLELAPCWQLPSIGDLNNEELTDIWFSKKFREQRKAMKNLKCPGCMLLCHTEPGHFEWYNNIYKNR